MCSSDSTLPKAGIPLRRIPFFTIQNTSRSEYCCTSGDVRSEACGYIVPAFFPIMFELTILFSAFTAFFGRSSRDGIPQQAPSSNAILSQSEKLLLGRNRSLSKSESIRHLAYC